MRAVIKWSGWKDRSKSGLREAHGVGNEGGLRGGLTCGYAPRYARQGAFRPQKKQIALCEGCGMLKRASGRTRVTCGMWKRAVGCGRGLWKRAVECGRGLWNVECGRGLWNVEEGCGLWNVEEGCGMGLWNRASGRTRGVVVSTCMRVTEEQKRGSEAYTSGSEITSRSIACTRSPRACSMASSAPSPHLPTGEKRRGEHLHARLQHGLERAVAAPAHGGEAPW